MRKVFKELIKDEQGERLGPVVHIGDWEYQYETKREPEFDSTGRATGRMLRTDTARNPKPDHYVEAEAEIVEGADGGLYDKNDHVSLRRLEYPSIAEQLDALWKGGAEADAMRERVLAVKTKHQKVKP